MNAGTRGQPRKQTDRVPLLHVAAFDPTPHGTCFAARFAYFYACTVLLRYTHAHVSALLAGRAG